MRAPPQGTLELLLCDSMDGRPALAEGLPTDAAALAPRPTKAPVLADSFPRDGRDADPNDLPVQRWAVLFTDTPDAEARLRAIAPLIDLRAEEQGSDVQKYKIKPRMSLQEAADWKRDVWAVKEQSERPRYLLLLGDLDEISLETQHVLSNGPFAGRLHAPDLDGYAQYAQKAVRWARDPGAAAAAARMFVADDSTEATTLARVYLADECVELSRSAREFPGGAFIDLPSPDDAAELLDASHTDRPTVLLSVSHGLCRPRSKWGSAAEQRALQGALSVGRELGPERFLTAETLKRGAFLPGGLWFCLACYGAGTPTSSAFYPWLKQLAGDSPYHDRAEAALKCLPEEGEPAFIAALPKAALANPDGPLAMIAHVDLAWTYAFMDSGSRSRASHIFECVAAMANGSRAGVALDRLKDPYRDVNEELLSSYEAEQYAAQIGAPSPVKPRQRANDYMLRNDLRGYILLGDPAARLPLQKNALRPAARRPAVTLGEIADPAGMEAAVLDLLAGRAEEAETAARLGKTPGDLRRWIDAYREAGRAALARLR